MQKFFYKLVKKLLFEFCSFIQVDIPVKYYGTSYGGWYVAEQYMSDNLNILSAGVGEDISFDIEILNKFKSKIIFIDPTPRAIAHIEKIVENIGNKKTIPYDDKSGNQKVQSYELSNIQIDSFILIEKALYSESDLVIKFYKPNNDAFVSHSISNFQNQYNKKSDYIEVSTTNIEDIIKTHRINEIDILKLDIEGAENQVIPDFLRRKIFPKQLLVEFDELTTSFIKPYLKAFMIFIKLILNSYCLVKTQNFPNFLFVKKT